MGRGREDAEGVQVLWLRVPQGEGGGAGPLTTRSQGEAEGHVGLGVDHHICESVNTLLLFCPLLELMPLPTLTPGFLGFRGHGPLPSLGVFQARAICIVCHLSGVPGAAVVQTMPAGPQWSWAGAMLATPNHAPDPSHGGYLCVHIVSWDPQPPEAREGDEAIGPISAYQGSSRVRLGVEAKVRSGVPLLGLTFLKRANICRSDLDLLYLKTLYVPWILFGYSQSLARTMAPQCS